MANDSAFGHSVLARALEWEGTTSSCYQEALEIWDAL
jgi:hypothetical protein